VADSALGLLVGDEDAEIVGESHYQPALRRIVGYVDPARGASFRCVVRLVREPTNRYDKNAVRADVGNETVAYLSRDDAEMWQPLFRRLERERRPAVATATIRGGFALDRGPASFGVFLDGLPVI
jgi:hypothetical protein